MEITVEQRKQLLEYLSRRPYSEVYLLVAMLVSLKPKTPKTRKSLIPISVPPMADSNFHQ